MSELVPASSSSEKITGTLNTGLLDLSVEPSIRDIMAGSEFTLFVLIKNPFPVPVWINKVHVNLPSELKLVVDTRKMLAEEKKLAEKKEKEQDELLKSIYKGISSIEEVVEHSNHQELQLALRQLTSSLKEVLEPKKSWFYILSRLASVRSELHLVKILYETYIHYEYIKTREVVLEGSLPENIALQSGNTVVYSVILNVKNKLLFNPSKYRLQFNANFMFEPSSICKTPLNNEREKIINEKKQENIFANTIAYELSIRASLSSVITGSMLGGVTGGLGRILQLSHSDLSIILNPNNVVAIITAIILSIMAIIFMGRKSDTQSFISVEDFWGGLLVGFLVGYTGTSFFEDLTGLRAKD